MNHKGKAWRAAWRLIGWTLVLLFVLLGFGILAAVVGTFLAALSSVLVGAWAVFALFCLWFFRDPDPVVPLAPEAIVAPAHGKVDAIDETEEVLFLKGPCRRVSIFLSVFDVHVQFSPVASSVALLRETSGQFLNAMNADSARHNENVLLGLESTERPGERVAVRLIAGLIARRIIPWIKPGDELRRGERISLIQFGSRVDLYLPLNAEVRVKLGDRVRGGETVIATRG